MVLQRSIACAIFFKCICAVIFHKISFYCLAIKQFFLCLVFRDLSNKTHTNLCWILAGHDTAESMRGDRRSSAAPYIKNLQHLQWLLLLPQRLKTLVRAQPTAVNPNRVRACDKWDSRSVSFPHSHYGSSDRNGRDHRVMRSSQVVTIRSGASFTSVTHSSVYFP
jgi:hypothetical protein